MTEDKRSTGFVPRLYVAQPLKAECDITLDATQTHYLFHVMRRKKGDRLFLFNGRDGEWAAHVAAGKCLAQIKVGARTRPQKKATDLWLLFAPLRQGRSSWLAQKAGELGVGSLYPVLTEYSNVRVVNCDRLRANAIEGAEQSGQLSVCEIHAPQRLVSLLASWPSDRALIFCDESLTEGAPLTQLSALRGRQRFAILIGPDGGFASAERAQISALPLVQALRLGDNILRAETAALAALVLFQAAIGDWRN